MALTTRIALATTLLLWSDAAPAQESPPPAEAPPPAEEAASDDLDWEKLAAEAEVITVREEAPPPGSSYVIGRDQLERFEHDDVHKVLAAIPGVYLREEDGYGLRPNIGMRGAASERSAKIALLEDGVLIAPAPYSAPAAYYFPTVTRMVSLEVTKGPAAIVYGPNTVGGALGMFSRPIPAERQIYLDAAGGSDLYGKLHAAYGQAGDRFGILIEGVKLHSDGFKQLDGGGDTGFDKNDVMVKSRVRLGESKQHEINVKLGYTDELSNETYTGLADRDFAVTPYRRYAGTQLDLMDWRHLQLQATHRASWRSRYTLTTTAYRQDFARDWRKLNGFNTDRTLNEILAAPEAGNNAVFYAVLTGQADSSSPSEALVIGTNERDYVSQGVQTALSAQTGWFGLEHQVDAGARVHADSADRFHFEDGHVMMNGRLVRDATPRLVSRDAIGSAVALAAYLREEVTAGDFHISAGLRGELVRTRWHDRGDPTLDASATYGVLIPGAGVVYQPTRSLHLLAGVHKGFVPVAPGEEDGADPEESINYEAGARFTTHWLNAEAIGFFSDYSNLKGTCTFSSGCDTMQIDREFNAGAVHIYGLEARAGVEPRLGALRFPATMSYTLSRSRFQSAFQSANPEWGDVEQGDELPYLPVHQISAQAGARGASWDVAAAWRYTSPMRDVAGQGPVPDGEATDPIHSLDLAAACRFGAWGKAYLSVTNALDHAAIVSRRPFGARPGVPRLIILGYKQDL